ncbi:hypothetical protein ACWDUL_20700 [Nocardia niigatensis]
MTEQDSDTADTGETRRTIRVSDEEWKQWGASAKAAGELLARRIRRAMHTIDMAEGVGVEMEFLATQRNPSPDCTVFQPVVVRGTLEAVRKLFHPSDWILEQRPVGPYVPAPKR